MSEIARVLQFSHGYLIFTMFWEVPPCLKNLSTWNLVCKTFTGKWFCYHRSLKLPIDEYLCWQACCCGEASFKYCRYQYTIMSLLENSTAEIVPSLVPGCCVSTGTKTGHHFITLSPPHNIENFPQLSYSPLYTWAGHLHLHIYHNNFILFAMFQLRRHLPCEWSGQAGGHLLCHQWSPHHVPAPAHHRQQLREVGIHHTVELSMKYHGSFQNFRWRPLQGRFQP